MYMSSSKYTHVYVSNIEYAMLGFTVGGPKPEWHLYYVQLVISLDDEAGPPYLTVQVLA